VGELSMPEALRTPPLSGLGNVSEIAGRFGGAGEMARAVATLQKMLYAQ